jgi:hypothetical protein
LFKLDFVPIQTERYFLLCEERTLQLPAMRSLLAIVSSDAFKSKVNQLPGYQADETTGEVLDLRSTFPTLEQGSGSAGSGTGRRGRRDPSAR